MQRTSSRTRPEAVAAARKWAGADLVAKTRAALFIVKAAVEYVERAGERDR